MRRPAAIPSRRFAAPVLLLLAALCAPATAGIDLKIEGNASMGKRRIMDVMAPEPEQFSEDEMESWREDAEFYVYDLYRADGWFDAVVAVEVKRRGDDPNDWEAIMKVSEGDRYLFDTVRVVIVRDTGAPGSPPAASGADATGADSTGADTLGLEAPKPSQVVDSSELSAKVGKPYQEELIYKDKRLVLREYGDAGYVRAKVDEKLTPRPASKTVTVDYLVEPSYPVVFDTLIIRNLRAPPHDTLLGITRDHLIDDLVPYKKGDTVRISRNDRVIQKLQYTGTFTFVRMRDSLLPERDHRSALLLYAEEHVPGNVRSSVFAEAYYDETGLSFDPGVSMDARHSNVAGSMNEVRMGASLATRRQNAYTGYGSPLTLGYLIRFDEDLDFDWAQDRDVHEDEGLFKGDFRATNSTRLTWPWSNWLRMVGNAEFELKSRMVNEDERERNLNLNFIQTEFLSFLNQPMDPTRGLRFALTFGNGGPLIKNGDFQLNEFRHNWVEAQTAQYYYLPALRQVKWATRLDGGRFFGAGGANSERFFLGGSRSVRSYGYQELCTERSLQADANGNPLVGECVGQDKELAYLLASWELRLEPFDFGFSRTKGWLRHLVPLQIVPFFDFGKVWEVGWGFDLSSDGDTPAGAIAVDRAQANGQGYATGIGFRYPLLGIFNFRLDFVGGSGPRRWWLDLAQAF